MNTGKRKHANMNVHSKTATKRRRRGSREAGHGGGALKPTIVELLPPDMVIEVIARVAASSFFDYFNAKFTCKCFREAADDKLVYERVSVGKLWWRLSEKALAFLNMCKECGNTEVLYQEGMKEYFKGIAPANGIESLKRAAELGHIGGSYVLGILLICSGDEGSRKKGVDILNGIKRSKSTRQQVIGIRRDLAAKRFWVSNFDILKNWPKCCGAWDRHQQKEGWPSEESAVEDYLWCNECWCDRQISYFISEFYNTSLQQFRDIIPPIHGNR